MDDDTEFNNLNDSLLNLKQRKRTVTISDTNQLIYQDEDLIKPIHPNDFRYSRFNRSYSTSSQTSQKKQNSNSSFTSNSNVDPSLNAGHQVRRRRIVSEGVGQSEDNKPLEEKKRNLNCEDSSTELEYLKKCSEKIANNEDLNMSSSSTSRDSLVSDRKDEKSNKVLSVQREKHVDQDFDKKKGLLTVKTEEKEQLVRKVNIIFNLEFAQNEIGLFFFQKFLYRHVD